MKKIDISWMEKNAKAEKVIPYDYGMNIAVYAIREWDCAFDLYPYKSFIFDNENEAVTFLKKMELQQEGNLCIWKNAELEPYFHPYFSKLKFADKFDKFHVEFTNNAVASDFIDAKIYNETLGGDNGGFGDTDFGGAASTTFTHKKCTTKEEFINFFIENSRSISCFLYRNKEDNYSAVEYKVEKELRKNIKSLYGLKFNIFQSDYNGRSGKDWYKNRLIKEVEITSKTDFKEFTGIGFFVKRI